MNKTKELDELLVEMPPLTQKERKDCFKKTKKALKTKNPGIEKIMKYCSALTKIFKYPYFFNWSTPTNHVDNSPTGQFKDVSYVTFRIGKYITSDDGMSGPKEQQLVFGLVSQIVNRHIPFNVLLGTSNVINTLEDIENNKYEKEIKEQRTELSEEKKKQIKAHFEKVKAEQEAVKKKENTHKMAEANKAFAHYRW